MTLTELCASELARLEDVRKLRAIVDEALAEYHRARDRLAYHTRKNSPQPTLDRAHREAFEARIAWQRARRALIKAM